MSLALASHLKPKKPLSAAVTCYGIPSPTICDLSVIAVTTPVQVRGFKHKLMKR